MIKVASYTLLASLFFLFSCQKKDEVGVQAKYTGNPMVNFSNYMDDNGNFGYHKVDLDLKDSFINVNIEIKLTNTTGTAPNDIYIYLMKVDALVSSYNTANGTSLEPVSNASAAIDFDFSKPVVLKKGSRAVTIPLRVNAAKLDLSKSNALGVAIARVDGADLNTGVESKLVIEFGTKNKYDGIYKIKGYGYLGTTNTTAPYTFSIPCGDPNEVTVFTSGANSVRMDYQPLYKAGAIIGYNNVLPEITFNPANDQVSNVSGYGASTSFVFPTTLSPGYNSRYDNATKTIYVSYGFTLSTTWVVRDTLTYCRPR